MRTLDRLGVLYIRNLYWPLDFGGNRYALEVTTRLARRGHRVRVVTGRRIGDQAQHRSEGVSIRYFLVWRGHPLATHLTNALLSIRAITRELRQDPPDVAIVASYDVAVTYFRRNRRPPSIYVYHSSFYSESVEKLRRSGLLLRAFYALLSRYVRFAERTALSSADGIIAVSEFSREEILRRVPGAIERISTIPTGVDTATFRPPIDRSAVRAELGIGGDARVLVVVGRMVPVKRYDRAIDAVSRFTESGVPTLLLVVGEGPEKKVLIEHARSLRVTDRVRFMGHQTGEHLVKILQAADLQLCTSDFENLSLALLEGLSVGLPVVALPTGGTVGLLSSIDPLLLADDISVESLVRTARRLLTDEALRVNTGARCRRYVVERHDWESIVDRVEDHISRVLAR